MSEIINDVRPFRALHYDPQKVRDVGLCLSQPYDVISAAQQERYYRQHEHNVIRLILNREEAGDDGGSNCYTRVRDLLGAWRRQGVLTHTERPSFWVYEQEFDIPEIGRKKVKGFIGLVRLQDYEKRRVLPHEKVLTRPLEDRIRLTRCTDTQFEYIWSIYQDKAYVIDNVLDAAEKSAPFVDFYEEQTFVRHRMWPMSDARHCEIIRQTMERLKIYIADGHHRYQAMLTYREEMREAHPKAGPDAPWEFIMMFLVNSEHEGLTILPTHRLLRDLDLQRKSLSELHLSILEHFHVKSYSFLTNGAAEPEARRRWLRDLRDSEAGVHKFGALIAGMNRYFLITLKDTEAYEEMVDIDNTSVWKQLDVNILNTLLLNRIVGLTENELASQSNVEYTKDVDAALEAVRNGSAQVALILNSTRLEDVITIAENNERMPRKSTHFYPKPLSGLLFFPMREG